MTSTAILLAAAMRGAEISPCGQYRYTLTRQWDDGPCVGFLMFNPSTADALEDDATIRKCIGFAKSWGYGRMTVINLYAIRNRDPKAVARAVDPVGPMNGYWIQEAAKEMRSIVCAWGCGQHFPKGGKQRDLVIGTLPDIPIYCLGRGKDGNPRHPLMLAYSTPLEVFA